MLKARPHRLRAAVLALPPKKAPLRSTKPAVATFRAQLLSKPVSALTRVRLRPKALEALPQLATELRNLPLRERVLALSVQYAGELRWPTLVRLLPWVMDHAPLRGAAYARCKGSTPPPESPDWVRLHWRAAFAKNHYVSRTLDAALEAEPVVAELLLGLGLRGRSPFASALLAGAVERLTPAELMAQPWTQTLRFIDRSAAPWPPRRAMLLGILGALPHGEPRHMRSDPALRELFALTERRLGTPGLRPGAWRDVPAGARALERAYQALQPLLAAFDPERAQLWLELGATEVERLPHATLIPLPGLLCAQRGPSGPVRVWAQSQAEGVRVGLAQGRRATELPEGLARLEEGVGLKGEIAALLEKQGSACAR